MGVTFHCTLSPQRIDHNLFYIIMHYKSHTWSYSSETMTFKLGAILHIPHFHYSIVCIPIHRAFVCLLWTLDWV